MRLVTDVDSRTRSWMKRVYHKALSRPSTIPNKKSTKRTGARKWRRGSEALASGGFSAFSPLDPQCPVRTADRRHIPSSTRALATQWHAGTCVTASSFTVDVCDNLHPQFPGLRVRPPPYSACCVLFHALALPSAVNCYHENVDLCQLPGRWN